MKRHFDLVPPAVPVATPSPRGFQGRLQALYASADPRSLGLLRIALGVLLMFDTASRWGEVEAHYANTGWLPNHFALFKPMSDHLFSVYFAFGAPLEVKLLLCIHIGVCALLALGYRTKLMQLLALLLTTSLNSRNILLENGGSVVLNILLLWTAFLPLGRRFSVDALKASLRARRETTQAALNDRLEPERDVRPVVSLAVTALLLQWAAIYFFNALQKNGAPWRDGSAVYYFLQQDRLITSLGAWLRHAMPYAGLKLMTFVALGIEWAVPFLLLVPWRPRVTRVVALGLVALLHVSIDSVLRLGAFSWAMLLGLLAFVPAETWSLLAARWARRRTACVVHFDPDCGSFLLLCRVIKRLDALGLVTFRAIDDDSPKKAERALCVSVLGQKSSLSWDALLAVADACWFGRRPLQLVSPFVRRRVQRRLVQLATAPDEIDGELGLARLVDEADARLPEPTPARLMAGKLAFVLRDALVAFFLVACGIDLLRANQAIPERYKPTEAGLFRAAVAYPRVFQGWSMFAPAPPTSDGRLVIDGRTKDGRHLDPLTGHEPVFELQPAGEPRANLIWGYFHTRIAEDRFRTYWGNVRDFVMSHHKLTERPEDELASFDAIYVTQSFPKPGEPRKPPERRRLFSSSFVPGDSGSTTLPRQKPKPSKPRAE